MKKEVKRRSSKYIFGVNKEEMGEILKIKEPFKIEDLEWDENVQKYIIKVKAIYKGTDIDDFDESVISSYIETMDHLNQYVDVEDHIQEIQKDKKAIWKWVSYFCRTMK